MLLSEECSFSFLLLLIKVSVRLLNLGLLFSFSLLLNFCFEFLLTDSYHTFADFNLLFLLCNFSSCSSDVNGLLLFLLLNFVSSVSFSLLGIRDTLKVSLLNFKVILFLCDFEVSSNLCVVCRLSGFSLCNLHVAFSICTRNRSSLLDCYSLINTEVFDNLAVIGEVLDVEGFNDNAELLKVRNSVFKNLFRNLLTVSNHVDQVHLADDFTHVAFQNVDNHSLNSTDVFVQEVLSSFLNIVRLVRNLRINNSVDCNVNVILGRNRVLGLDVNRNQLQAKNVSTFKERNLETGMTDNCSELSETRDNDYFVRRSLDIRRNEEDDNEQYEQADARTDEEVGTNH